MSTYSERIDEARMDAIWERECGERRELWRWCAHEVAKRAGKYHKFMGVYAWPVIEARLMLAIDDVPDLDVLIQKVKPDMMAFAESRMTAEEAYRW